MSRWRGLMIGLMIVLAVVLVTVNVAQSRHAARRDAWRLIAERGAVLVGTDAAYPPFEWVDERGAFQGYDVALARELGVRWGVEVVFVDIAFDGLYDALLARKVDLILSALPYDALLTRDVLYSQPYWMAGQVIVVPAGNAAVQGQADLRGRIAAVELGSEGHAVLSQLNRDRGLGADILALTDLAAAAAALGSGEAAALVCDRVDALQLTAAGTATIVGEPLTQEPYVVAVRPDSPQLAREIDRALADLARAGTLNALEQIWLMGAR